MICSKCFPEKYILERQDSSHWNRPFKCEKCSKDLFSKQVFLNMKEHILEKDHLNVKHIQRLIHNNHVFRDMEKYIQEKSLSLENVHSELKPHECENCSKSFEHLSNLKTI